MEDTSLTVSYVDLNNDGETLVTKSSAINASVNGILEVLGQDWSSWIGEDKAAYVDKLRSFVRLLATYSDEINDIGAFMQNAASGYSTAVSNFKGADE